MMVSPLRGAFITVLRMDTLIFHYHFSILN